jgi:hypothetical protein
MFAIGKSDLPLVRGHEGQGEDARRSSVLAGDYPEAIAVTRDVLNKDPRLERSGLR